MDRDQNNQPPSGQPGPGQGIGKVMVMGAWIVGLLLLTFFFRHWEERAINPNQQPLSYMSDGGVQEVVLDQNRYGHYVTSGKINQGSVTFILDTGASEVSIPEHIARKLGLKYGPPVKRMTANGTIEVFLTNLERLSIGNIQLFEVSATINPYSREDKILLGMSVLKRLEFTQRGAQLTLKQYPANQH